MGNKFTTEHIEKANENVAENKKDVERFELIDKDLKNISGGKAGKINGYKNYPGSSVKKP